MRKTTHELARELLAGPDVPAVVATTTQPGGDPPMDFAKVSYGEGYDAIDGGDCEPFAEIHAECEKPTCADAAE